MSDWTRPRRGRRTVLLVTAGVVLAAACFGIGRWTAPSNGGPGIAGPAGPTTQAAPAPPGTAAAAATSFSSRTPAPPRPVSPAGMCRCRKPAMAQPR